MIWTPDRAGYAITGGRLGLRSVADGRLVTLRLRMTGRRSGAEREIPIVILAPTDEGADA